MCTKAMDDAGLHPAHAGAGATWMRDALAPEVIDLLSVVSRTSRAETGWGKSNAHRCQRGGRDAGWLEWRKGGRS
jgi:hypothetical protein